jgi:GNAT superfamily N-acetyltransferase
MDTLDLRVSYSHSDVDLDLVHSFLSASYWSPDISREVVERAIQNSLVVVALRTNEGGTESQVGFARIISDRATFAYLCDVFVVEGLRGMSIGKRLMAAADAHPEITSTRRWLLATIDAHTLYSQSGYTPLQSPGRWMERRSDQSLWKRRPD